MPPASALYLEQVSQMKKIRSHRGNLPAATIAGKAGSLRRGAAVQAKTAVSRRGDPPLCITCLLPFDVKWENGTPKFFDHGTDIPHRCKS